jgi:hypothetical protein
MIIIIWGVSMFDWKILAASFAALLVVSSVLVGGSGFTDIFDRLRDFLGGSPLSGLLTAPVGGSRQASVTITQDTMALALESHGFKVYEAEFKDFSGTMNVDFGAEALAFSPSGSSTQVSFPLKAMALEDIKISSLDLEETDFMVVSDGLETSGKEAGLVIRNFSGSITILEGSVRLSGNFTSIEGNGKVIV